MHIYISSGNGVDEVCRALWHFLEWLKKQYSFEVLHLEMADCSKGYRSILLESNDRELKALEGTLLWRAKSPFRPKHKRKNWYFTLKTYKTTESTEIDQKQIVYQTMKSPKKGGQHVNTTNSGVRAVYPPLKLEALCFDERSQHRNKQIARERLLEKVQTLTQYQYHTAQQQQWRDGKQVIRGNPVKIFEGNRFRENH